MILGDTPAKPDENATFGDGAAPHAAPAQPELQLPADLARIVAAWSTLPAPIRRAMLALIG
jgi:hypothetical protein